MAGRGAWNNAGVGGTKKYRDPNRPGPYYFTGTGYKTGTRDANEYAVFMAVKAYQAALTLAGVRCYVDGLYGPATTRAMTTFQEQKAKAGADITVWAGSAQSPASCC